MRRLLAICLASVISAFAIAQNDDFHFALYLVESGLKEDARVFLESDRWTPSDTLEYLKGWTFYNSELLQQASDHFSAVPQNSAFFDKSFYYNVICNAHLGRYNDCEALLNSWKGAKDDLFWLEKAGLSLLQNKPESYLDAASRYSGTAALLSDSFLTLSQIYDDTYGKRGKSPWVAALSSSIIPGAGQYYAGNKVEGVMTFLLCGALAAVAVEHTRHYGPQDWRSIACYAAGAGLYITNIGRAALSVSIQNEKLHQDRNLAVLYNIHIPLRTVFR